MPRAGRRFTLPPWQAPSSMLDVGAWASWFSGMLWGFQAQVAGGFPPGHLSVVKALLQSGAHPSLEDEDGSRPQLRLDSRGPIFLELECRLHSRAVPKGLDSLERLPLKVRRRLDEADVVTRKLEPSLACNNADLRSSAIPFLIGQRCNHCFRDVAALVIAWVTLAVSLR